MFFWNEDRIEITLLETVKMETFEINDPFYHFVPFSTSSDHQYSFRRASDIRDLLFVVIHNVLDFAKSGI